MSRVNKFFEDFSTADVLFGLIVDLWAVITRLIVVIHLLVMFGYKHYNSQLY
jgi:hypothetical protein